MKENLADIFEEPSLPEAWTDALTEAGALYLQWTYLKGREHEVRRVPDAIEAFADFEVDEEPLPFNEAIDALQARLPVDSETFDRIADALKFRAFAAARLAERDAVTGLQQVLQKSMEEGESLLGFIDRVGESDILQRVGFNDEDPWYLETVYRTNTSTAYNAGRRQQIQENGGTDHMVYVAIIDARTTDICRRYDGIRRPVDDPIWDTITPPNHFNERSTVRAVYRGTAEADRDITTERDTRQAVQEEPPGDGFEAAPSSAGELAELPPDLEDRARQFGILEDLRERQTELGF